MFGHRKPKTCLISLNQKWLIVSTLKYDHWDTLANYAIWVRYITTVQPQTQNKFGVTRRKICDTFKWVYLGSKMLSIKEIHMRPKKQLSTLCCILFKIVPSLLSPIISYYYLLIWKFYLLVSSKIVVETLQPRISTRLLSISNLKIWKLKDTNN